MNGGVMESSGVKKPNITKIKYLKKDKKSKMLVDTKALNPEIRLLQSFK